MLYIVKLLDDCRFAKDMKGGGCVLIEESAWKNRGRPNNARVAGMPAKIRTRNV
jgi:hypothetical protein